MFCSSVHGRIFAAGFVLAMAFAADSIFAREGRKLRAGYASLSGNMAPYWAAKDAGLRGIGGTGGQGGNGRQGQERFLHARVSKQRG